MTYDLTALRDLLALCENATGPDRELDYLLERLTRPSGGARAADEAEFAILADKTSRKKYKNDMDIRRSCRNTFIFRYTRSLDAAVALVQRVLPLWSGMVRWGNDERGVYAGAYVARNDGYPFEAGAKTAQIALIKSMLRALIAIEEGK